MYYPTDRDHGTRFKAQSEGLIGVRLGLWVRGCIQRPLSSSILGHWDRSLGFGSWDLVFVHGSGFLRLWTMGLGC